MADIKTIVSELLLLCSITLALLNAHRLGSSESITKQEVGSF